MKLLRQVPSAVEMIKVVRKSRSIRFRPIDGFFFCSNGDKDMRDFITEDWDLIDTLSRNLCTIYTLESRGGRRQLVKPIGQPPPKLPSVQECEEVRRIIAPECNDPLYPSLVLFNGVGTPALVLRKYLAYSRDAIKSDFQTLMGKLGKLSAGPEALLISDKEFREFRRSMWIKDGKDKCVRYLVTDGITQLLRAVASMVNPIG